MDKERPAPDMCDLEVNEKGEQVVKEAISDLAANFPGQLCTHWVDVSVRAPAAERCTTSAKKVAACAMMGEEDKQKCYKGRALAMVVGSYGTFGPESEKVLKILAMAPEHTATSRPVVHVGRLAAVSVVVCHSGCSPASFWLGAAPEAPG